MDRCSPPQHPAGRRQLGERLLRIVLIAVGKVKDASLRACIDGYLKRVRRYTACDEVEVKDAPPAELAIRLQRAIPPRHLVVTLEVEGQALSSQALAQHLERCSHRGAVGVALLIGGAYGLPPLDNVDLRLSLSAMTLPHRLARLVLAEQLYRAFTILRGEPYDH